MATLPHLTLLDEIAPAQNQKVVTINEALTGFDNALNGALTLSGSGAVAVTPAQWQGNACPYNELGHNSVNPGLTRRGKSLFLIGEVQP